MRLSPGLALAVLTVAACASLVGIDGDPAVRKADSGFSDGGLPDAITSTDTETGSDGRIPDGNISDATGSDEVADDTDAYRADARAAPDGASGFCAHNQGIAGLLLCDDFDQPGRVDVGMEGWGQYRTATGVYASLGTIESSVFLTSPRALMIQLMQDTGLQAVTQTFPFASTAQTFTYSVSVYPAIGVMTDLILGISLPDEECIVAIAASGTTLLLSCGGIGQTGGPTATPLIEGQWNKVAVTLTRTGNGLIFSFSVGAISSTPQTLPPPNRDAAPVLQIAASVQLGNAFNDLLDHETGAIYYDDVLVSSN